MRKFMILIATGLIGTMSTKADQPKWYVAPIVDEKPNLEQGLNAPVWKKALKISFNQLYNASGTSTMYPSETYWLYAGTSLFVGFKFINPDAPELWVAKPNQPHDHPAVFNGENMELFVGDFDSNLYYQLVIDAVGNLYDGEKHSKKWDAKWNYRVKICEKYWTVIVEIPKDILATIWKKGSFITISIGRSSYRSDGTEREMTVLVNPGYHSPTERLFIGEIKPRELGERIDLAVKNLKSMFAAESFPAKVANELDAMDKVARIYCASPNISLAEYRQDYDQYIQFKRKLAELKCDTVLSFIFK